MAKCVTCSSFFSKWSPLAFKEGFTVFPVLTKPKSRGSIRLRNVEKGTKIYCLLSFYFSYLPSYFFRYFLSYLPTKLLTYLLIYLLTNVFTYLLTHWITTYWPTLYFFYLSYVPNIFGTYIVNQKVRVMSIMIFA